MYPTEENQNQQFDNQPENKTYEQYGFSETPDFHQQNTYITAPVGTEQWTINPQSPKRNKALPIIIGSVILLLVIITAVPAYFCANGSLQEALVRYSATPTPTVNAAQTASAQATATVVQQGEDLVNLEFKYDQIFKPLGTAAQKFADDTQKLQISQANLPTFQQDMVAMRNASNQAQTQMNAVTIPADLTSFNLSVSTQHFSNSLAAYTQLCNDFLQFTQTFNRGLLTDMQNQQTNFENEYNSGADVINNAATTLKVRQMEKVDISNT